MPIFSVNFQIIIVKIDQKNLLKIKVQNRLFKNEKVFFHQHVLTDNSQVRVPRGFGLDNM